MIFQLITPAISMTFAICFLAIYVYDKDKKAPLILSIAYTCGAISLVLDYFRLSFDPAYAAIVTNTLYTATLFLTTISIAIHFRTRAPILLMSVICFMEAGLLIHFIYYQPDIAMRTLIANGTAATLMACALLIIPFKSKMIINRLLFWVAAASSMQFFLRTIFIYYMAYHLGYVLTDANYSQSIITISLHFSIAVISLLFATTACIAFGMEAISDIKKIAGTDVLSGLLNRRDFEIEARKMIASSKAQNLPVTMIFADLDKFKEVNDKYGHLVGDEVIHTFGKKIRTICRSSDIAGRMGGEEFCIMLQTADLNLGRLIAESLRQEMQNYTYNAGNKFFSVTASFGVAQLQENQGYNDLFIQADEELYNAKHSGRNQVRPKRINYILKSVI